MDNIATSVDSPEEEYVEQCEQSQPLKRIGARVSLGKYLSGLSRPSGESSPSGSDRDESDFFSSSDTSGSDGDADAKNEFPGESKIKDAERRAKKAAAREDAAQAVKAGAAMVGNLVGLLTYLALDPDPEDGVRVPLKELRIFVVCDTQELAGVCHFASWVRMFFESLRITKSSNFRVLIDVQPCSEHGLATAFEEATKLLVDYLPATYTSGESFEKRLRIFSSATKKRLCRLFCLERLRVREFVGDAAEQTEFDRRQTYEKHFHEFCRTLLAGTPWRFAAKNAGDEDGGSRIIEIREPSDGDNRLADAVEDIRGNKPEELFCCGSWGGIAFNRWMKVDAVFKSIISQGYYCLPVLSGQAAHHDDATGEMVVFTEREQKKLREVAVCAKLAGLGSVRAQGATLTAPEHPEVCEHYDRAANEAHLRRARWRAFREGSILSARRIIFAPRDCEHGGCGEQSRGSSHQQRDAAGVGLQAGNAAFRGRLIYRKTAWKRLCAAFEDASSGHRDHLLKCLSRDAKDKDGDWSRPPPRRKLEEGRSGDGFLKWVSAHDSRASVVAFSHNAATLRACELGEQKRLMVNHLWHMARVKDASVAVERFNRHPKTEAQAFRTGAARNTEIIQKRARHCSGLFAGADKVVTRHKREVQGLENNVLDWKERSGARYQYQHTTKSRNELDRGFMQKTAAEREQLDADCRRRHDEEYRRLADPAKESLNKLTAKGEPGDVTHARVQLRRQHNLRESTAWLKKNLFLSRSVVADYSRASTDAFSRYSLKETFAAQAFRAMQQYFFWAPRPCLLAEAIGILRRNRGQARKNLKLRLPQSRKSSDLPEAFGRAAEAGILRAAAAAGDSYLQDRADDKGKVVSSDITGGQASTATASEAAAEAAAKDELAGQFEELLATAIKQAVQIGKSNAKAAALCQRLAPLRERNTVLIVELRSKPTTHAGGSAGRARRVEHSHWAVHWDISRPDRASLVRIEAAQRTTDAFVRLGGWRDAPEIVSLDRDKIELQSPSDFRDPFRAAQTTEAAAEAGQQPANNCKELVCVGAEARALGGGGGSSVANPLADGDVDLHPVQPALATKKSTAKAKAKANKAANAKNSAKVGTEKPTAANSSSSSSACGGRELGGTAAGSSASSSSAQHERQAVTGAASASNESSCANVFKARLADGDWRDVQDFSNALYGDAEQLRFYLATIAVVFPVARNEKELTASLHFPCTMPRDPDSAALFEMLEQHEQELSCFCPTLSDYSTANLPPSFRGSFDPPAVANDPFILYEKKTEVKPVTGVGRILTKAASGGPHEEEDREKKKTDHHQSSKDLFVYSAAVRRSYKVTQACHVLKMEIHGVAPSQEQEQEGLSAEADRERLEQPLRDEEESDDAAWTFTGVSEHDRNASTDEVKRFARQSFGSSENQLGGDPKEEAELALVLVASTAADELENKKKLQLHETDFDFFPEAESGTGSRFGNAEQQLLEGQRSSTSLHLLPRSSHSNAADELGHGRELEGERQGAATGEDNVGDVEDERLLECGPSSSSRARPSGSRVIAENQEAVVAVGGAGTDRGAAAAPVLPSVTAEPGYADAAARHNQMLQQGSAGLPQHAFWPVDTFTWVSREQQLERYRKQNEIASSLQCKPLPWTAEGKRYYMTWEKFPNLAADLFLAQQSTKGSTRAFQAGRNHHARLALQCWAHRCRFILKHFKDRRSKPPSDVERKLLNRDYERWMHSARAEVALATDPSNAQEVKKRDELNSTSLEEWHYVLLSHRPTFSLISREIATQTVHGQELRTQRAERLREEERQREMQQRARAKAKAQAKARIKKYPRFGVR
eukprot:g17437.t1